MGTSWKYQLFRLLSNQIIFWSWTPDSTLQVIMFQSSVLFLHLYPSLKDVWVSKHLELIAQSELRPRFLREVFTLSHHQERIQQLLFLSLILIVPHSSISYVKDIPHTKNCIKFYLNVYKGHTQTPLIDLWCFYFWLARTDVNHLKWWHNRLNQMSWVLL